MLPPDEAAGFGAGLVTGLGAGLGLASTGRVFDLETSSPGLCRMTSTGPGFSAWGAAIFTAVGVSLLRGAGASPVAGCVVVASVTVATATSTINFLISVLHLCFRWADRLADPSV